MMNDNTNTGMAWRDFEPTGWAPYFLLGNTNVTDKLAQAVHYNDKVKFFRGNRKSAWVVRKGDKANSPKVTISQ